jgi:Trehalase-like, N-terminal
VSAGDRAREVRRDPSGGYPPIGDYGVIGDGRTAALISRRGSVDWLCLPQFSAPSVFGAILDHRRGGRFVVCPEQIGQVSRRYVGPTNVLETTFRTEHGVVRVTDLMPIARDALQPERELLRIVEGVDGEADVRVSFEPRPDYARARVRLVRRGACTFACEHAGELFALQADLPLEIDERAGAVAGRVPLRAGERRYLSLSYAHGGIAVLPGSGRMPTAVSRPRCAGGRTGSAAVATTGRIGMRWCAAR